MISILEINLSIYNSLAFSCEDSILYNQYKYSLQFTLTVVNHLNMLFWENIPFVQRLFFPNFVKFCKDESTKNLLRAGEESRFFLLGQLDTRIRQIDRKADRQIGRQIDRQVDRQTQTHGQIDRQVDFCAQIDGSSWVCPVPDQAQQSGPASLACNPLAANTQTTKMDSKLVLLPAAVLLVLALVPAGQPHVAVVQFPGLSMLLVKLKAQFGQGGKGGSRVELLVLPSHVSVNQTRPHRPVWRGEGGHSVHLTCVCVHCTKSLSLHLS